MAVKLGLRLQKSVLSDMYTGQSVNQNGETIMEFDEKERKYGITDSSENKLEYFRKLMLEHLDTMEKALMYAESLTKGCMSVGTVSENCGAKLAIAAIRNKIAEAKDEKEMMDIVLENKDRFSDKNGNPLPFVQELSTYIAEKQDEQQKNVWQIPEESSEKEPLLGIPQTPEKSSAKSNDIKKSVFAVLRSIPLPQLVKSLMNLEDKTA